MGSTRKTDPRVNEGGRGPIEEERRVQGYIHDRTFSVYEQRSSEPFESTKRFYVKEVVRTFSVDEENR